MEYEEYKGFVVSAVAVLENVSEELVNLPDGWLQPLYSNRSEHMLTPIRLAQRWLQEREKYMKTLPPPAVPPRNPVP